MTKRFLNNFFIFTTTSWSMCFAGGRILEKAFEIEVCKDPIWDWFYLSLGWSRKQDHAGPYFRLGLPFFSFEAKIYDCRHWNYDADRWYLPGEEQAKMIEYGEVDLLDNGHHEGNF